MLHGQAWHAIGRRQDSKRAIAKESRNKDCEVTEGPTRDRQTAEAGQAVGACAVSPSCLASAYCRICLIILPRISVTSTG